MGVRDPGPTHVEGRRVDLPSGLGSGTVTCSVSSPEGSGGGVALLVPGMEGSASSYAPLISAADRAGSAVLVPDMDDLGGPQGRDFVPFLRALARDGPPDALGPLRAVIGHSLGARVALRGLGSLPEDTEVTAIVVSAGSGSVRGEDGGSVDGSCLPLLVVHSQGDVLSSHAGGAAVFDAAAGPKVMLSLEGTDHGAGVWTASSEDLQEHVGAVIETFLLGAPRREWSDVQEAARSLVDAGLGTARFDLDPSARPAPSGASATAGGPSARPSTSTVTDIRSREDLDRLVGDRPPEELLVVLQRYGIDRFLIGAFTHISSRFIPERTEGRDAVIQWHVASPDGVHPYLLEVEGVRCDARAGEHPAPTLTVRITLEDLARFLAGRLDAMEAFVSGSLQVSGDLRFAVALERWFDHG